jgi:hypothetical protein
VESHTVAIELGETSKFVDLTIKSDADIATIRGIVVDELGQPIPGAQIRHCDASASERDQWISLSDFRPGNETKDKGTFVIEGENEKPGTRVLLRATKEGYQSIERSTHVWGATDLRLVLRRGVTVTVIVADAETKCPVEWFGMRMFTATDAGDRIEVALGEHAGGTVQTRPVQRGEYQCWIDPKDGKWLRTQRRISVRDDLPLEIRIQLPRAAVRTLRVESTSGKPVEGTKVEIVESTNGARVGLQRDGEEMLWCEGRTGATGGFELRGPVSKELTARILGPGHPPMLVRKLLLGSSSDPILVKVPQGGTIHGKISPQEFLARMRKLGKTDLRENPPGLRLERGAPVNRPRESMPLGWVASFPLEADGSFEISEIAAGTWRLALCWRRSDGQGGGSYNSIPLGLVTDLRDGERRKLEFDLSHLQPEHGNRGVPGRS